MTVLNGSEIDNLVKIIEHLTIAPYTVTVEEIKKRYHLSKEEYDMCMDLAMPSIRKYNDARFYKQAYMHTALKLGKILQNLIDNPRNLDSEGLLNYAKKELFEALEEVEQNKLKKELSKYELEETA